jgi:hypothetical protein
MKNIKNYTELQKVMLVNAHPIKLIFNAIGGGLGLYFLWQQDGLNALVIGFGICLLGTVFSLFKKLDLEKTASTFWGKFFLCYSSGIGFALYLISHILIPYAFWIHNLFVALFGLLVLLVGALIYRKVLT